MKTNILSASLGYVVGMNVSALFHADAKRIESPHISRMFHLDVEIRRKFLLAMIIQQYGFMSVCLSVDIYHHFFANNNYVSVIGLPFIFRRASDFAFPIILLQ